MIKGDDVSDTLQELLTALDEIEQLKADRERLLEALKECVGFLPMSFTLDKERNGYKDLITEMENK